MPSAAFHPYFWADQGEEPVAGPQLTAMSRYLGPPLLALLGLMLSGCFVGLM